MDAQTRHSPLIIIGSGPAGYTCAVYAARAMLKPMLISGFEPGGQLMITTEVENYPGFADPIQGPWLMEQMRKQAEHVGTEMVADHIMKADLSARPFRLEGDSGTTYTADALVISTGARARWLGLPSEETFKGYGVSACATCDGFFYRGKDVVVVGGGNSAVEEALYLTQLARHVTVVHRRDSFRAERILQERLFAKPNVDVIWNHSVEEILGNHDPLGVTGARLRSTVDGGTRTLSIHGVFVAIGHSRRPTCSRTSSSSRAPATSRRRRTRRPPASRACSRPATSPTTSGARPLPPPAWAAWPRSRSTAGWR